MGYREKVVVVGAGISGLACACALKQSGIFPLVIECSSRPGGVINTVRRNGFLFEMGPQCPRFPTSVWRLLSDLNLEGEFIAGDPKIKRYIFRNGRLYRAPFSPGGLLRTGLLSVYSKFRLLSEGFRSSHPPAMEETLAAFVQRKFGDEVLDNLVDPIVSTVFFGDAHKMGMESAFPRLVEWERNHHSVTRGALRSLQSRRRKQPIPDTFPARSTAKANRNSLRVTDQLPSLGSFRSGMATLPEKLAEELKTEIRYGCSARFIAARQDETPNAKSHWQIGLASGEVIETEYLVLAVPAYAAGELLARSAPRLAHALQEIDYAPAFVLSCAYNRSAFQHDLDGFGFMVPQRESLNTICTFWNSSLFPRRAPEDQFVITTFARRDSTQSDAQVASKLREENAEILGIQCDPIDQEIWSESQALPQYNVGHARLLGEISGNLTTLPRLYLIGNYLNGRSLGDCVDTALQTAHQLDSQIRIPNI
jgi:protoporphyrinogen/coproporphyrinogen III oxidase